MADFSIVEFVVYALIGYSGIVVMIVQLIKYNQPTSKAEAVWRTIWIFPCIIAIGMLTYIDGNVEMNTITSTETITSNYEVINQTGGNIVTLNSTTLKTNTDINYIDLRDPIWVRFHVLLFFVMIIYQIIMWLTLFIKVSKRDND